MAWAEPPLRQTGDLITAEIWNTDVVDNLNALYDANFRGVYDSGWFAVTYGSVYQKAHGLAGTPRHMVVLWASAAQPSDWHVVTTVVNDGGAVRGLAMYPTQEAVRVKTGSNAVNGTIATPIVGSGAGYYRVLAWE